MAVSEKVKAFERGELARLAEKIREAGGDESLSTECLGRLSGQTSGLRELSDFQFLNLCRDAVGEFRLP
jgi:hypothetical protein